MRFLAGGINGHYLLDIVENAREKTEVVIAAVAYANDSSLLFDWCWTHNIPLKFYGRLDEGVAISIPILTTFLQRKSPDFTCRLVQHHHAKVIWWRGFGAYIGSANLTSSAWYKNIEAGCFFPEEEIDDELAGGLTDLFSTLEQHSTPLNEEVLKEMQQRAKALTTARIGSNEFWSSPSFFRWSGLVRTAPKKALDRKREEFLREWHATLQILRDIGSRISVESERPKWVSKSAPQGAQADQFLHAHYYQRVVDGRRAHYETFFERNKTQQNSALNEAIEWWGKLPSAPSFEDKMLNDDAPFLLQTLSETGLSSMTQQKFREVCMAVHSIKDYSRRVPNRLVGLPDLGTRYSIEQKVEALASRIWNSRTANGRSIVEVLKHILYEGPSEQVPERLWQAVSDPSWKISGLGISALGETIGWALPDRFPPRNGRTSKALRSLGYDVAIHVE